MDTAIYVAGMVALWAVNLLNGTGLGAAYRTTEYARILLIVLCVFVMQLRVRRDGACLVEKRYFYTLLPLLAVFTAVSLINGHGWMGPEYLWAFLVTFLLANTKPSRKTLRWIGFCFAGLGLAILFIFNYMDALDGWNANTIAMIGLFSYLVFIIPYYGAEDFKSFIMLALAGGAYIFLLWPTESRSCIIAIIMALILVFRVVSIDKLMSSKPKILLVLLVPLLVAVLISLLSVVTDIAGWDAWSIERYGKPIFNGRDQTWLYGFRELLKAPLFGSGYINTGLWHNSAITCLTAYGVIGFVLWTRLFHLVLSESIPYQYDTCVMGCLTAFAVIFWQQSVELGLFGTNPNLLPYTILGLLLGRVNYLKDQNYES